MKKVIFTSVYRDQTGYGQAGLDYIGALEQSGLDIVCKPVRLTQPSINKSYKSISHLESKDLNNIDCVIQYCLPHFFEYRAGIKNIGMFDWETSGFGRSSWANSCNLMDEIWVPCIQNKHAAISSGVKTKINVVPHPYNINKINEKTEPLNIPSIKNKCAFYFIGEFNLRKNIVGTIKSYFRAFTSNDDVVLIIKTNKGGMSPKELTATISKNIEDIKNGMHLYNNKKLYPPIIVITEFLDDEKLLRLHRSCSVFISLSRGEGGCLPAYDALAFGNPVIASNYGVFPDLLYAQSDKYFDDGEFLNTGEIETGWLINGQLTPCFSPDSSMIDLYTGKEDWFEPNLIDASKKLQDAYIKWRDGKLISMIKSCKERLYDFSYEKIGRLMNEYISN